MKPDVRVCFWFYSIIYNKESENIFKYSQKPFLSEYLFYQFHTLFTTKKQKHMSFYVKKNVLVMAHPNFHPLPQPRVRAISKSRPLPPHVSWSYSPTPDMCNGFFPPEFIRGAPSLKRSQKKGIFSFSKNISASLLLDPNLREQTDNGGWFDQLQLSVSRTPPPPPVGPTLSAANVLCAIVQLGQT